MNYVIAIGLGMTGVVCIVASQRHSLRFQLKDYAGDKWTRLRDGLIFAAWISSAAFCIAAALLVGTMPDRVESILPFVACLATATLPIVLFRMYHVAGFHERFFGGYTPLLRYTLLGEKPLPGEPKIDPEAYREKPRTLVVAGIVSVIAMAVVFSLLEFGLSWNGSEWSHLLLSVGGALLMGFSAFVQTAGAITSRQILRFGKEAQREK